MKGLGQFKTPLTSSEIVPTTFWLVAQCLKLCAPVYVYNKVKIYICHSNSTYFKTALLLLHDPVDRDTV
jgi:hypothetical protein